MKLVTIGCSFTEGQELEYQSVECYSTKLAEQLKIEFYNFGATGMSNDYIFRKTFELINSNTITNEDILIIQWTNYWRKELPVVYNEREWFHSIPNSTHAYEDKVLMKWPTEYSVQNAYIGQNLDKESKFIESENKKAIDLYNLKFLNENYQINTTKNYINSLYAYLEYYGYKHIQFFGWDACIIESVFENKPNFLQETFAGYTNTKTENIAGSANHPDKKGHKKWANFLFKKINSIGYLNEFQAKIDIYRKELSRLQYEIEKSLQHSNLKIKEEKQKELDIEIENIRREKELQLEKVIEKDKIKLNALRGLIQEQIKIEENIKTLI
jgi:hypothetical protein